MDQGSNQTLAVDVTSMASSFANLVLNPSPFNLLPNEILLKILSKVDRMVSIQKFARLRSVDTRWRFVVDDICKGRNFLKKSLTLDIFREFSSGRTLHVEDPFFGLSIETGFMRVKIIVELVIDDQLTVDYYDEEPGCRDFYHHYEVKDNILESLLKEYPKVEQLAICDHSGQIAGQLSSYVNSLGLLKQLYYYGPIDSIWCPMRSFSRLELFIINSVRCVAINFDYVCQLHDRNPGWLANVNHLSFTVGLNDRFDQVVNFLRQHATRLNVLYTKFGDATQITFAQFRQFGKLTRLGEIALGPVKFKVLKQAENAIKHNQFTPLSTIVTCTLVISGVDLNSKNKGLKFADTLLAIFPNVLDLKIDFVNMVGPPMGIPLKQLRKILGNHLERSTNVRRFKIVKQTVDEFFVSLNSSTCF